MYVPEVEKELKNIKSVVLFGIEVRKEKRLCKMLKEQSDLLSTLHRIAPN